jgi:uncharacterized membrane protein
VRFRTYILLVFVILLKPFSNLLFAGGLKAFPHHLSTNPGVYLWAMLNPLVAIAVALQILWLLGRMALLSRADLSFVLPATASGYVLSALFGHWFLAEQITFTQGLGILLVFIGSSFVGSTKLSTTNAATPTSLQHDEPQASNFSRT